MEKHIKILAVCYLVLGGLGLAIGALLFVVIAGGGAISGDTSVMAITTTVATVIAGIILLFSVPAIIAGFGLLKRAGWARILTLILGALNLLNIPFGTILGAYSLWVLLNPEITAIFEREG